MNEQQANALFTQSVSLLQQGQHQDALKILSKLDKVSPSNPGILFFTATGHSIAGNKRKAIQIYERVLRLNPQFIEAYNNIALDLAHLGEHQQAIAFIDRALAIRPNFIEAVDNKGCFLNALGNYRSACDCFERALSLNPQDTFALANLAIALIHLGDYVKARSYTDALIAINPNDYKGHSNLGKISLKQEDPETAISHFITAHKCNVNDADTFSDLATAYSELNRFEDAQHHFKKALSIKPDHGPSHLGLGLMNLDLRNFDQAIAHFSMPIQDKYRLTLREYNRALTYLHSGDLEKGWMDYRWRWKESNLPIPYLQTTNLLWKGQPTDEIVLIWNEQGIGDQILFGSLLIEAAQTAPNLLVRLDKRLIPLFQRSLPSIRFLPEDHPISDSDFKYHSPIGDLAQIFRNSLEKFDRQPNSYLKADSTIHDTLSDNLRVGDTTVGLAWSTQGKRSKERNLPIDEVVSIIYGLKPSTLVDLQYSDTTEDRLRIAERQGINVQRLDKVDNFRDLDSLAALISVCDFVVTCSNSTAHLAGGLGKETFLLVPFGRGRHWYWSHVRDDGRSMWYPSVQIIPQAVAGDWSHPLKRLSALLA